MTTEPEERYPTPTFDPRRFVTRVSGSDYLEVKWRVYWLRTLHPDAVIATELYWHDNGVAIFKASVSIPGGGSATGWGDESYDDFKDYLTKAETKALGRALAALGFGTQFTTDFDEGQGQVADAPVQRRPQRPAPQRSPLRTMSDYDEPPDHVPARQGMTERQMSFIRQMARDRDISDEAMDKRVQELFGKAFDQLERVEASSLIERLREVATTQPSR